MVEAGEGPSEGPKSTSAWREGFEVLMDVDPKCPEELESRRMDRTTRESSQCLIKSKT